MIYKAKRKSNNSSFWNTSTKCINTFATILIILVVAFFVVKSILFIDYHISSSLSVAMLNISLTKKIDYKYTVFNILFTLKNMKVLQQKWIGFEPIYEITSIIGILYDIFRFNKDKGVIRYNKNFYTIFNKNGMQFFSKNKILLIHFKNKCFAFFYSTTIKVIIVSYCTFAK